MRALPAPGSRIAIGLALVAFVVATASVAPQFVSSTWIIRDCRFHVNVNQTLVESGSLEQHAFASSWYDADLRWNHDLDPAWSNVALGRNGEYWPKHTYLLPIVATPAYYAFGLLGTLLFNLFLFGWIAAAGFRFGREYATPTAAAMGVGVFLFGTAVLESAYNYSADLLQVAFFVTGLAMAVSRRPTPAGIFVALAVMVRPTALILLATPILVYVERRAWRELRAALLAGAATLGLFAIANAVMYGRPWWTGYNRTVVRVAGEATVASHVDAFSVPFAEGLRRTFDGHYPLGRAFAVMPFALPGLVRLLRRGKWTMIGLVVGLLADVYVFSRYVYEGHRFHWVAFALAIPALAASAEVFAEGLARLARHRLPLLAAVAAIAVCASTVFFDPIDVRVSGDWRGAAETIPTGTFDLRAVYGEGAFADTEYAERSRAASGPGGAWLPRASPLAILAAAPFAALGPWGLVVLHLLAIGAAVFFAALFLGRLAPEPVAALAPALVVMLPEVRDEVLRGGPLLLALPLALAALTLVCPPRAGPVPLRPGARTPPASTRRLIAAGALAVAAAWIAESPWLALPLLPLLSHRRAGLDAAKGAAPALVVWAVTSAILWGAPFASADDVVVMGGEVVSAPRRGLADVLVQAAADRIGARMIFVPLALAPLGVPAAWRVDWRRGAALGLLALAAFAPGVGTHSPDWAWQPLSMLLLALPLAPLADSLAGLWELVPPRWRKPHLVLGCALAILASVGVGRRLQQNREPFRMASFHGVRGAVVLLDDRIPCDFLAWEHLSWECSQYDRGLMNMVGRATSSEEVRIGGEQFELLLIPSGPSQPRTVTWPEVEAGDQLALRWAVPDGMRGAGTLTVSVNGDARKTIELPAEPTGEAIESVVDTSDLAGQTVRLTLEVRPTAGGVATVALDGIWR